MHHRTWWDCASGLDFSTGHPYISREKNSISNRRSSPVNSYLEIIRVYISSLIFFFSMCRCIRVE